MITFNDAKARQFMGISTKSRKHQAKASNAHSLQKRAQEDTSLNKKIKKRVFLSTLWSESWDQAEPKGEANHDRVHTWTQKQSKPS